MKYFLQVVGWFIRLTLPEISEVVLIYIIYTVLSLATSFCESFMFSSISKFKT